MKPEKMAAALALLLMTLVAMHLASDMVYGYEPPTQRTLIAIPFAALWLYATLILAGSRSGYILLLIGGLLAAVVPMVHMSGNGVREAVVKSDGGYFFLLTLVALAMASAVSVLHSFHGLVRLKSVIGFVLAAAIAAAMAAAIAYLFVLKPA